MEEMHGLYDAVISLDGEKVKQIIGNGFDLNTRDLQGNTLLHSVILNEQSPEVIKFVVELGVDLNSLNTRKWSPLFVLRKYLIPNNSNKVLHQWLMEKGAVSHPDSLGGKW